MLHLDVSFLEKNNCMLTHAWIDKELESQSAGSLSLSIQVYCNM